MDDQLQQMNKDSFVQEAIAEDVVMPQMKNPALKEEPAADEKAVLRRKMAGKEAQAKRRKEKYSAEKDMYAAAATDLRGFADSLKATRKRLGDSFAMILVKEKLRNIDELEKRTDLPALEKQSMLHIAMLDLEKACERYRDARYKGKKPESTRHKLVDAVLKYTTNYLDKNIMKDPDVSIGFFDARTALSGLLRQSGFSKLKKSMETLDNLLSEEVSTEKDKLTGQRLALMKGYRNVLSIMEKYAADTARKTDRTKQNYRIISDALLQLGLEYDRIGAIGEDEIKKHGTTWKNALSTRGRVLTEKDKKHGQIVSEGDSDAKMTVLYKALGFTCCADFVQAQQLGVDKKGRAKRNKVSVCEGEKSYKTKKEIMSKAKKSKTEVIYAKNVVFDLTSIQILDMIAGVKNRSEDTLGFKFRENKVGNRKVIELYDVRILSTKGAFTTEKALQYNEDKETGRFRIFDPIADDRERRLIFPVYDYNLADRIMAFTDKDMMQALNRSGILLSEQEKDALLSRLSAVRRSLRFDKETGRRQEQKDAYKWILKHHSQKYRLLDESLLDDGYINEEKERLRDEELARKKKPEKKEVQTENERFVKEVRKAAKKETRSGKLRKEAKRSLQKNVSALMHGIGDAASSELRQIGNLILLYAGIDVTSAKIDETEFRALLKEYYKKQTDKLYEEMIDIEDLFYEKRQDAVNSRPAEEKKGNVPPLNVALGHRGLYAERISLIDIYAAIESAKKRLKGDELVVLGKFEELLSGTRGELDVPENAKVFSDENITYKYNRKKILMLDTSKVPLFTHEPCIEDIKQGALGDCYLLAAIGSVVETDPLSIKQMMRDNGKTVTVRLYDKDGSPKYFTVKKEVPAKNDEVLNEPFASGAFWVQYLEKAYTLMQAGTEYFMDKFTNPKGMFNAWFDKGSRHYDDIDGGREEDALKTLTGKTTQTKRVSYRMLFFDRDATLTDEDIRKNYAGNLRTLLKDLKQAGRSNKMIVASTRMMNVGEAGGLNSEMIGRGIAATHAYTVLGVETIAGKEMIKLKNPWGQGGMDYKTQKDSDVLITRWKDATAYEPFYITPERFVAYFTKYTVA